jgi:hemerythrin-like domain-containing protein
VLAVRSYVNLVQPHIVRENSIVFPMADAMLPATEHDRLLGDFDVIETTLLGERRRQHFEAMLDEMEALVAAWPSPLAAPSAHLSPTFFSSVRAY